MISRLLRISLTGLLLPLASLAVVAQDSPPDPHGIDIHPQPAASLVPTFTAGEAVIPAPAPAPARAGGFPGINREQQATEIFHSAWPPSPTIGVGPNHVVEVQNQSMAIYTRGGTRISHVRLSAFLQAMKGGNIYISEWDPKIIYDAPTGRWFLACLGKSATPAAVPDPILLAVSTSSDPTKPWMKYILDVGIRPIGDITYAAGNLTFGIDGNGVYLGLRFFPSTGTRFNKIIATRKSTLVAAVPTLGPVHQFSNLIGNVSSPVPVTNLEKISATHPAWFAASINVLRTDVRLWKLTWNGATPTLSDALTVTTPAYGYPLNIPHLGGIMTMDTTDERIQTAVLSKGHLWVARTIGTNAAGTDATPDRTGCEWLDISLTGPAPSLTQSGRIYDTAPVSPRSYCFPALGVNPAGHALISFMGMSSTEYMSVWFTGREATYAPGTMGPVQLLKAGNAAYNALVADDTVLANGRCGSVCLDPVDNFTLWTVQTYAHAATTTNCWGTWIASVGFSKPPGAATISSTSLKFQKVAVRKTKNQTFTLSNNGFYPLKVTVGKPAAPFTITSGAGASTIAPGKKKTITVRFKPTNKKKKTGTIKITTNDPKKPTLTVKLTGTGK